jgi:Tol biopolymer transport system component
VFVALFVFGVARADLVIDVQGMAKPAPVAIVPFGWEGDGPEIPLDVVKVIRDDLFRSGRFAPIDESKMLQKPTDGADVDFKDWGFVGVEAVVVGKVIQTGANAYNLQFQLFDVFGRRQLVGYRMPASRGTMRGAAHRAADMIYKELTGIDGVFRTKVAYVTAKREGEGRLYSLIVSDQDGFNEHTIMESADPIMSPAWSPDSRQLASSSLTFPSKVTSHLFSCRHCGLVIASKCPRNRESTVRHHFRPTAASWWSRWVAPRATSISMCWTSIHGARRDSRRTEQLIPRGRGRQTAATYTLRLTVVAAHRSTG